jgi:hypothetical protein
MLRSYKTVLDIDPEEARMTMGSPGSIQRIVERRNLAMYAAWQEGVLLLPEGPNKVPWEILRENDPRELQGDDLRNFFLHLTTFAEGKMQTNPLRPYLQYSYYDHLAHAWGIAGNAVILSPQFVDDVVHGYPGYLGEHALSIDVFLDQEKFEEQPLHGDIFIADAS